MNFISNIFGGKSWYKSLTAWGVVIFVAGSAGIETACDPNTMVLGAATCATVQGWFQIIGAALATLGIRKAATAPDVQPK